jgi:Fe-S cluster biosynthesis and repair protein YggX
MSTDLDERIAQFENMTTADPENDMAHFSLGTAYLQAGRAAEAATSLLRCVELNEDMSKAYQLAGEAMIKAGWSDKAVKTLEQGYEIAAAKGDLMPRDAIADLLRELGRTPPELSAETKSRAKEVLESGTFICSRTGRAGTKLDAPPMRGPVGQWIGENISAQTWDEWIGQGTKVINEMRLDFSREEDQNTFDQQMYEYLGISADLRKELTGV